MRKRSLALILTAAVFILASVSDDLPLLFAAGKPRSNEQTGDHRFKNHFVDSKRKGGDLDVPAFQFLHEHGFSD